MTTLFIQTRQFLIDNLGIKSNYFTNLMTSQHHNNYYNFV